MAGILDNKSRIMDVIVTKQGRRQLASGKMRIQFASFTDANTFYRSDIVSGSADATERIYFEAASSISDDVTFETDDTGALVGFDFGSDVSVVGDQIFEKSVSGSNLGDFLFTSGSEFASLAAGLVTSSIDHFRNQYPLGSRDPFDADRDLSISTNKLTYTIDSFRPIRQLGEDKGETEADIDTIEPFFTDKRLSHLQKFKFLPPVIPDSVINPFLEQSRESLRAIASDPDSGISEADISIFLSQGRRLGLYKNLNEEDNLTFEQLMLELEGTERSVIDAISDKSEADISTGFNDNSLLRSGEALEIPTSGKSTSKERKQIIFNSTSESNNIVMQMFELGNHRFKKLDVIDFGEFNVSSDSRPNKHVFFIGKVFLDSVKVPTFVNLFTMVID